MACFPLNFRHFLSQPVVMGQKSGGLRLRQAPYGEPLPCIGRSHGSPEPSRILRFAALLRPACRRLAKAMNDQAEVEEWTPLGVKLRGRRSKTDKPPRVEEVLLSRAGGPKFTEKDDQGGRQQWLRRHRGSLPAVTALRLSVPVRGAACLR